PMQRGAAQTDLRFAFGISLGFICLLLREFLAVGWAALDTSLLDHSYARLSHRHRGHIWPLEFRAWAISV
ncbi:hypothetical protein, partial [Acetobacter persici]|uniref:hypothetical protein n=1 Tax=Acetobacter persici TaxID=1076596 RepID=UPI001C4F4FB8